MSAVIPCLQDTSLTPWQTTHKGTPSPSSHSPGPRGIDTGPPEFVTPVVELGSNPLFLSFHSVMTSSMTILVESSNDINTDLKSRIHSRSCRTQVHGEDQSRSITISVSGTDCGVRRGRKRGAKDGDGSDRRYIETRARISMVMIISFCGTVVGEIRTNLHDRHRGHLGMYNPKQIHSQ